MTSGEISSKEKWNEGQIQLSALFEKEIHLMRETLANLHQEELSLMENAFDQFEKILQERSDLIVDLSTLRLAQNKKNDELLELGKILNKKETLPIDEEACFDSLSKIDQILALVERINLQNCRNQALFDMVKSQEELPLYCAYPHPKAQSFLSKQAKPKAKRRLSLRTDTPNEPT